MPTTPAERARWIRVHLGNDLKYLASAATTWAWSDASDGNEPPGVKALALDSALLHVRALGDFFTDDKDNDLRGRYGFKQQTSRVYNRAVRREIHKFVMHLDRRDRSRLRRPHLKDRPVILANEIVRLWTLAAKDFVIGSPPRVAMDEVCRSCLDEANGNAKHLGGDPVF